MSSSISFVGIDSIFEKEIIILSGKFDRIDFNDATFKNEVFLSAFKVEKMINIIGNTFEDKMMFHGRDSSSIIRAFIVPEEIWIQDNKFQNGFHYDSDLMVVDKLSIIFSEKSSGVLEFENSFFTNVNLIGNNFNNSIFFRDCTYEKLTFSNLFNRALISFNNNVPNNSNPDYKELKIENSNLGNTEFYDFDFTVFNVVRIIDSRLDSIFTYGVEWFEPNQLQVDGGETNEIKILSQKREIYRQLKLAAEKQSDRITALKFKAREVHAHSSILETNKIPSKKWFKNLGDIISINLGRTNDHGQNWIKPFLYIIGITLVFYPFLMILSDPNITFAWNWTLVGWDLFWDKFGEHSKAIPQLFNPARSLSDLFENRDSFCLYFLDGFQRIVLAFFIFQIVSAFRKFVK